MEKKIISNTPWSVRLASRAGFWIFSALALVVALVASTNYIRWRDVEIQAAYSRGQGKVGLLSIALEQRFLRFKDAAIAVTEQKQIRKYIGEDRWDLAAFQAYNNLHSALIPVECLIFADPAGTKAVASSGPECSPLDSREFNEWLLNRPEDASALFSGLIHKAGAKGSVLLVGAPIINEKGVKDGNIVLQFDSSDVFDIESASENPEPGETFILDPNSRAYAAHDANVSSARQVLLSSLAKKAASNGAGSELLDNGATNKTTVASYAPINGFGWAVVNEIPLESALRTFYGIERSDFLALIALIVLAIAAFGIYSLAAKKFEKHHRWENGFMNSSSDGMVAVDKNWNIVLMNPAAAEMTGAKMQECLGQPLRERVKFVRTRDRAESVLFISDAIISGETRSPDEETLLISKSGAELPVKNTATPIFGFDGKPIGAMITFHDTSKERGASMIRSSFAYAHHQLRTPVTAAMWNIELALEDCTNKVLKKRIAEALHSMESVKKLVNELIEVSEIDQGLIMAKKEQVPLAKLISEVVEVAKEKAGKRNVALEVSQVSETATLECDRKLLGRVLEEILDNAISYSDTARKVWFNVSLTLTGLLFEVKDEGIGIPPEQQGIVYTKFFRGQNIPPESIGAGLGLYISNELVKFMNGKIWFRSDSKDGTIFYVSLPQDMNQVGLANKQPAV